MAKRKHSPAKPQAVPAPANVPAPATSNPFLRTLEIGLVICGVAATFLLFCYPLSDTDFWWHLRTGELIWANKTVPYVDCFTFTSRDRAWTDLHWGFQLLVTALYHAGGIPLVTLAKAAIVTGAVAVAWCAGGQHLPAWLKIPLWLLPVIAISGRAYERPEILTLLFLAAWMWILARVERKPWLIWLLPLLQVVWVNCHALFILGLVVGACYAVDFTARALANGVWGLGPAPESPPARNLIWAGGLAVLASFVNPYFEEGAFFPFILYRKFSADREIYKTIGEFQRPVDFFLRSFHDGKGIFAGFQNVYFDSELLLWCLTALSFVWFIVRLRRVNLYRVLLFAAFSHLAWQASRNTNIFALVSGTLLCANCGDALESWGWCSSPRAKKIFTPVMVAAVCGLMLAVVSGQWGTWTREGKAFRLGEPPAWFAHNAARFAGQPGFPNHAFVSNIGQAAVYVYHNGPDRLVFMDGRLEVASPQTFQAYLEICNRIATGNRSWEANLRDSNGELPTVLLDSRYSRREINALYQTPGWRLVYADAAAAVFLEDKTADRLRLPPVDPTPLMYPPDAVGPQKFHTEAREPGR